MRLRSKPYTRKGLFVIATCPTIAPRLGGI